jgi:(p)ppGpp synthase/HD superfamily hydrolase
MFTFTNHSNEFLKEYFQNQFSYLWNGAENRASFFQRIETVYSVLSDEYKFIELAYNTAKDAFRDKFRDSGERYFEHLRSVGLIGFVQNGQTSPLQVGGRLMHDTPEDIPSWDVQRVANVFGKELALALDQLKNPDKSVGSKELRMQILHQRQQSMSELAWKIKLDDRLHNMLTLWEPVTEEKRMRKVIETETHYLPQARKMGYNYWELASILQLHKTEKNFAGWK